MRQILFSSSKAIVARMPRPTPDQGSVLVRTSFSLTSTGTELATLRPIFADKDGSPNAERVTGLKNRAQHYLGKAISNPRLAVDRALAIARNAVHRRIVEAMPGPAPKPVVIGPLRWEQQAAKGCENNDGTLALVSGGDAG